MKKIALMPTRNDAWILDKSLSCLEAWVDHVIVSDQGSTDETLSICGKHPKVKVIHNRSKFHSTLVRQQLLEEARKIPGENFIISIDSDEFVTSDILSEKFWDNLQNHKRGTSFEMQWVQLWRSANMYRDDGSVWSNSWKVFAFLDDRKSNYEVSYRLNDHNPRVPAVLLNNIVRLDMPKVLHYQFVNWDRMLSKQRFYRAQDYLQQKPGLIQSVKINSMYYQSKLEADLRLKEVPDEWGGGYQTDIRNIGDEPPYWYDIFVLRWFKEYGLEFFSSLDIWDTDWEKIRNLAKGLKISGLPEAEIRDPRNIFVRFYHSRFGLLMFFLKPINRVLKYFYAKK